MIPTPSQISLVGSSGAGKSTLCRYLIDNRSKFFENARGKVYYFYAVWNKDIPQGPDIVALEGIPDLNLLKEEQGKGTIVVLDDLQATMNSSPQNRKILNELFTLYAHHYLLNLIVMFHNVFDVPRTARLNTTHWFLLRTNSDKIQIRNLLLQLFGDQFRSAVEAYEDALKKPFGHLFVNNIAEPRLLSDLTGLWPTLYLPRS